MQMRGLKARRQFKQAWLPLRHDRLLVPSSFSLSLPFSFSCKHLTHRYKVIHACWHTKPLRKVKQPETLGKHKCEGNCHKKVQNCAVAYAKHTSFMQLRSIWPHKSLQSPKLCTYTKTCVLKQRFTHFQYLHSCHDTHTHATIVQVSLI